MLRPDIAVLEGGYSIKGALPYVNLGICLAMAGCDYSAVREHDYDPGSIREQEDTMNYIMRLCRQLPDLYFYPKPGNYEKEAGYFIREREIFYDTDNILENQREELRDCDQCSGVRFIKSRAGWKQACYGVELPWDCCPVCEQEGYARFHQKNDGYQVFQMIDRKNRQYSYR
jgi:hypothetical protein